MSRRDQSFLVMVSLSAESSKQVIEICFLWKARLVKIHQVALLNMFLMNLSGPSVVLGVHMGIAARVRTPPWKSATFLKCAPLSSPFFNSFGPNDRLVLLLVLLIWRRVLQILLYSPQGMTIHLGTKFLKSLRCCKKIFAVLCREDLSRLKSVINTINRTRLPDGVMLYILTMSTL